MYIETFYIENDSIRSSAGLYELTEDLTFRVHRIQVNGKNINRKCNYYNFEKLNFIQSVLVFCAVNTFRSRYSGIHCLTIIVISIIISIKSKKNILECIKIKNSNYYNNKIS